MEKVIFFPYSWHVNENEENTQIRIFGLTQKNKSICVTVNNFTPYIYIELPDNINWTSVKAVMVGNKIDTIGDDPDFPIGAYSRTSKHDGPCKLVETEPDSGLFFGRLKLNGFPHDAHGTGVMYLWGSKTCESGKPELSSFLVF